MNRARTPTNHRGFAIVSAIFLLVTLAALGAFMLTFSNTQQITSTQDLQGSRAYWAAKGGIQWAVGRIDNSEDCNGTPDFTDGFVVTVECKPYSYDEGATTTTLYSVVSTARAGGNVGSISFVERQVQAFIDIRSAP